MAKYQRSYRNTAAIERAAARGARRGAGGGYRKKTNWMWYVGGAVAAYMFIAPVKTFVNNIFGKKEN